MDNISSSIASFFISFFLFYSLLFVIVVKPPKSIDLNSYVEVDFLTPPQEDENAKAKEKSSDDAKKDERQEIKEVKKQLVNDLFAKSDVEEVVKDLRNYKYKLKEVDAKQAKLELDKILASKARQAKAQAINNTGDKTEDKYLALLHQKIYAVWKTQPDDAGKTALVVFTILPDGSFTYYIKSISYGDDFKYRLVGSLDLLKQERLPPHDVRIRVNVKLVAKE